MMLTWRDKDDSLHSIPLASAAEVLKKFYADWPGGFAEIESALRTAARTAEQLEQSKARIADILMQDDGQANKEARKWLDRLDPGYLANYAAKAGIAGASSEAGV